MNKSVNRGHISYYFKNSFYVGINLNFVVQNHASLKQKTDMLDELKQLKVSIVNNLLAF